MLILSKIRYYLFAALAANLLLIFAACETNYQPAQSNTALCFVADTVSFDTIFTAEATATLRATLFNNSNENINIERIFLSGGEKSPFNVSINGQNATEVTDVRLAEGDSLIIFVNAQIPQSAAQQPTETTDYIEAQSGSSIARIVLHACAQNVVRVPVGMIRSETWTAHMPYFISGETELAVGEKLEITEGTTIYFAENAGLKVSGQIVARGARNKPINFCSRRTESFYKDIPGQWQGITFAANSKGNVLEHTHIAHAKTALALDSAAELTLLNAIIRDASAEAVAAQAATLDATNCLIYNSGKQLLRVIGGRTSLVHCTLAACYEWDLRKTPALQVSEEKNCAEVELFEVRNSIISGYQSDEVKIDSIDAARVRIENSLVRLSNKKQKTDSVYYHNAVFETEMHFANSETQDFSPTQKSAAYNAADKETADLVPDDIFGRPRNADLGPDMGAIELQEIMPQKD